MLEKKGAKRELNPELEKLLSDKSQPPSEYIDKITDKIYLGDIEGANDFNYLTKEKITHILSLIDINLQIPSTIGIEHKLIEIEDEENQNLIKHIKECFRYIENSKKIFIHCMCGISRSPSIVIAYLMWKTRCSLDDTYAFVLSRRIYIGPNDGFMEQLKFFDKLLKEKNYNLNEIDSGAFDNRVKNE